MSNITTQDAINQLLRMKKQCLGAQACCAQSQNANDYEARCLSMAITALCARRDAELLAAQEEL